MNQTITWNVIRALNDAQLNSSSLKCIELGTTMIIKIVEFQLSEENSCW